MVKENKNIDKKDMENLKSKELVEVEKENLKHEENVKGSEEKVEIAKKNSKKEIIKKEVAIARGNSLPISPKYSKYICKLISRKSPEKAMELLNLVILKKLAVRMPSLELPHQKGKGVAGARYPITAAKEILDVVKQLNANCVVNNLDNPIIRITMSNKASAPRKRGGRKAKRTNIYLEAVEKTKLVGTNK